MNKINEKIKIQKRFMQQYGRTGQTDIHMQRKKQNIRMTG